MKKTVIIAGVLATALFASVGLGACSITDGGNYSETFEGVISTETYTSQDAAAKAFIEHEIVDGSATVAYEKQADLTQEEIAALNLGDVKAEDVVSAEMGSVTYSPVSKARAAQFAADTSVSGGKEVSLIILGFEDNAFRYYIPQPSVGETISKSYLDSVCDLSSYTNFTMTAKSTTSVNSTVTVQGRTQSVKYTMDLSITLKVTETAAMIKTTTSAKGNFPAEEGMPEGTQSATVYIVVENGALVAYSQTNGGTYQRNDYAFADYDSLAELFNYQQPDIDHTLFEKTKTGFKLSPDKFDEYVEEYLGDEMDNFNGLIPQIKGEATYFVTDGRLAKGTAKVSAKGGASEQGMSISISIGASATTTYTDFGTTVVTLPAEIVVPSVS